MRPFAVLLLALLGLSLVAQETFPVNDVQDHRAEAYAFTNATIVTDYQTELEGATLLIRDRVIEAVGTGITVPDGYTVIDLEGKHVYPSFIDAFSTYGVKQAERSRNRRGFGSREEQIQSKTAGAYNANQAIRAEFDAAEILEVSDKAAKPLREIGFGATGSLRADGIARGTAAVVTLGEETENTVLIAPRVAAHFSFSKGVSTQDYPSSLMGAIALLRQTHMDAEWYAAQDPKPFIDQSLEALNAQSELPHIIEVNNWMNLLRADEIGESLGIQYIIKTDGDEYQRIEAVKATGARLIVPLGFPTAMDVEDPIDAQRVSLTDMKHWELAPTNPGALEKAGIEFALTTAANRKKPDFMKQLRKAIEHGLSEAGALKALTHTPAVMLGVEDKLGSLAPGKVASFLVTSGPVFDKKTEIHESWIQGRRHMLSREDEGDHRGTYTLTIGENEHPLEIAGEPGKYKVKIPVADSGDDAEGEEEKKKAKDITVKADFEGEMVTMSFEAEKDAGTTRLSGWKEGDDWLGRAELPDGTMVSWRADHMGPLEEKADGEKKEKPGKGRRGKPGEKDDTKAELGSVTYPFQAYGWTERPAAEDVLIRNATVWTNTDDGKLEETDVLIRDGKIAKIGKNLKARKARVIDGTGKHLTPGIIDEHSHTALQSVNDVATNSGMVRMYDVVDSEDVAIYRNLAGGVTAAQLLHGSANPIGGQSALVKMRWGALPDEMRIEGADGFIKFALGENVKRSRSNSSIRYPQTRMGVEQVYVDAFASARDYQAEWAAYNALSDAEKAKTPAPRRDLAMDTMVEILEGERFITCHSYVQSEINMLMKVAESFDFRINTFTHILEGYKVADKMAAHGVGGSTFSDWWAYKWEVRYAIPYGPTLMHDEGVVTVINSDSSEMIRRLNQEAAKSVKYGGMSEEDALKMVTLNPAKLLHLDDRMGSLQEGMDGDVVLWSDHPLSIYAKAEKTLVDGIVYFDAERDIELREAIRAERARLIQKLREEKKGGGPTRPAFGRPGRDFHCDDIVGLNADGWIMEETLR